MANAGNAKAQDIAKQKEKRATSQSDGGRTALGGFLFQILGTIALVAEADLWLEHSQADKDSIEDDDLQVLLRAVTHGVVTHEPAEQDAGVIEIAPDGTKLITLIQFKYSRQISPPPITPKNLEEIVKRLVASAGRLTRAGDVPAGYRLITNRPLHKDAMRLLQMAKGAHAGTGQSDETQGVMAGLHVIADRQLEVWRDKLQDFGREHGATDDEIARGIGTLVTDLLVETARDGEQQVELKKLVEAFTGHRDAVRITAKHVVHIAAKDLAKRRSDLWLRGRIVERQIINRIAAEAAKHALIILEGGGGQGKTVTLWMWANMIASVEDKGAFTLFEIADELKSAWVSGAVCAWRNVPVIDDPDHGDHAKALRRIKIANPKVTDPLLHLALDGVDEIAEAPTAPDRLRDLVQWCWAEEQRVAGTADRPVMTLVVTCRESLEFVARYLHRNAKLERPKSGGEKDEEEDEEEEGREKRIKPCVIKIDNFAPEELHAVTDSDSSPAHQRIAKHFSVRSGNVVGAPQQSGPPLRLSPPPRPMYPANPDIVRALQHPLIWRAFLQMDESTKERALDNDPDATRRLGRMVIDRFMQKVERRLPAPSLDLTHARYALQIIARHTISYPTAAPNSYARDWRNPACDGDERLFSASGAHTLFKEARSGGIIEQVTPTPTTWRWRHQLVCDYLATCTEFEGEVTT